jgi:hydrogenase maturation protease
MSNLRRQLGPCLEGRVCFMGLGNVDYGDDGFGVRLAEALMQAGLPNVISAGTMPERWIGRAASFDHIVFLDAVEFGGEPGSMALLDSAEMAARFPQISTHKISLALLAQWAEANGHTKAWLLGVQAESLKPSQELTQTLRETLGALCNLLKAGTNHGGTAALGCPAERELGSELEVSA